MPTALVSKEGSNGDAPVLLFDCTLADGTVERWSSRTVIYDGHTYDARVLRHNVFESQVATESLSGAAPRLTFELANADSHFSQVERQPGFKGARLVVRAIFVDGVTGSPSSDAVIVFSGLMNPPELISESVFRLSAINRMSMLRSVVPETRVQRMCPWRFPVTEAQRSEAVEGGPRGKFSPFYKCGYSPDQPGGSGNLDGTAPFTSCSGSRGDCEARGMFNSDSAGRVTARFGGIEFVPATILVRGTGQKTYTPSNVQDNLARYNDFVPLVYGTQWHSPDVVFSRNDGNLTRMEALIGMGPIQGVLKVIVNGYEIPQGVSGRNMTGSGWYNLITRGTRNGGQDPNFADGHGVAQGDPFGSMAYLSIVVPNRINDGSSLPSVRVLVEGLCLEVFNETGNAMGEAFSDNPAWVLLDILRRSGYAPEDLDLPSFAAAAAFAGELIAVNDPLGGRTMIPRFQCNFALKQRRSAGDVIRSLRNSSRIYLVLNAAGRLAARIENPLALQHAEKPEGSNAAETLDAGWPAYEFGPSSIARHPDLTSSVKLFSKPAQDTPNRLSVEFQDAFNQYQQDSLSLASGDDADLCGQEVAAGYDAVGISSFSQASRMLLLALNRGIAGNLFIEFQTSVKALGLMPGDLITVTYPKENLQRTPFRIVRIAPGNSFRTAAITAQIHDDAWYADNSNSITGGRGWHAGSGSGTPSPVCGIVADSNGNLQLGITETETQASDGSSGIELAVSFGKPDGRVSLLPAPILNLSPTILETGGSIPGNAHLFYAISAVDSAGAESPLSFVAQAMVNAESDENAVRLNGIMLPQAAVAFRVYRGHAPQQFLRIASDLPPATTFTDTGLPSQPMLPPDPNYDHVNLYWRWEYIPETAASIHSSVLVGNSILRMPENRYQGATVRITEGTGAGQERVITSNDAHTLTPAAPFSPAPDATSSFVVSESSWRGGSHSASTPVTVSLPQRMGATVHLMARAAAVNGDEAAYDGSPFCRWTIGQSGGLLLDSDTPPAPLFGLSVSPSRGGVIDLNAIAFTELVNTRGVIAGTYRFHYYDEINGDPPTPLGAATGTASTDLAIAGDFRAGTAIQVGDELMRITEYAAGTATVERGILGTVAAAHSALTPVYLLKEKTTIVPFVRNFFGSPVSGEWKSSLELPNVRVAAVELSLTNAIGSGPFSSLSLTSSIERGLRTCSGGQYTFQLSGYLALANNAAPAVVVDGDRTVRDIFAVLRAPSSGAGVTLQLNRNGAPYSTVQFDPGATVSSSVSGFGLPSLREGDLITLDVTGVGTTVPGSDLTLIMRL